MRRYLLDTSVLSAYLLGRRGAVSLVSPWISNREVATSILVYGEVIEYLKGRQDLEQRHAELRDLLAEVSPYFLTYRIVERYANVRRQLRPPHGPGLIGDIRRVPSLPLDTRARLIRPKFPRRPYEIEYDRRHERTVEHLIVHEKGQSW